jgi:hypothetical protein
MFFVVSRGDCVVFDQAELDRWEMYMDQRVRRQGIARMQAALFEGEYHTCPTCRQGIPKVNSC